MALENPSVTCSLTGQTKTWHRPVTGQSLELMPPSHGYVATPGGYGQLPLTINSGTFAYYYQIIARPDSVGFDPGQIQVRRASDNALIQPVHSLLNIGSFKSSYLFIQIPSGNYNVRIYGQNNTTGAFDVVMYLFGIIDPHKKFLSGCECMYGAYLVLRYAGGGNHVTAAYFKMVLRDDCGYTWYVDQPYIPTFDYNLSGWVATIDRTYVEHNCEGPTITEIEMDDNLPPEPHPGGPYGPIAHTSNTQYPSSIQLNGSQSLNAVTYQWYIGSVDHPTNNNLVATGMTPTITYNQVTQISPHNGIKTLWLRVTNPTGAATASTTIELANTPPVITSATSTRTSFVWNQTTTLNAVSSNPDSGFIVSRKWYVVDPEEPETLMEILPQSSGEINYEDLKAVTEKNGSFNLVFVVEDNSGGITTSTIPITLTNTKPTTDPGGPYVISRNESLQLEGSGQDVDGYIVEWQWYISGIPIEDAKQPDSIISYEQILAIVLETGTFELTLMAKDNDGEWSVV